MAKKKRSRKRQNGNILKTETKQSIYAIIFFALAIFLIIAGFKGAGVAGAFFYRIFFALFGVGYLLVPIICILLGISFIKSIDTTNVGRGRAISAILILLSGLGIIQTALPESSGGGMIGKLVSLPIVKLFDVYAGIIILGAIFIISLLILFNKPPKLGEIPEKIRGLFSKKEKEDMEYEEEDVEEEEEEEEDAEQEPTIAESEKNTGEEEYTVPVTPYQFVPYTPPPLSLLENDKGKPNVGDVKANANVIRRTLLNFGIEVEMDEVTIGPTVTRYALKPAQGVKLSRIVGLQNDLALALAAHPIRIQAPIPGKSLVGIEVPNQVKSIVGLASLIGAKEFVESPHPLLLSLGRAISGKAHFGNLAKMPHILIAGTTGSGKSVSVHTLITSLLYRNGPQDLRLILVDPKRVELTLYKKIPHLLTPVITDAKKTILALKWAAKEMDRRYDILEAEQCRDILSYKKKVSDFYERAKKSKKSIETAPENMPFIVIVIDELADIMTTYPRELEAAIVRLAQMSRAVGIHLILSTQRPSVNVITGLIKANIPARIAMQVSSQIDSRTILDMGGAEKLLGAGDMLYLSGEMSSPERLQSAFISEGEVKQIVKYLAKEFEDVLPESEINLTGSISAENGSSMEDLSEDDDEFYEEAKLLVIKAGKASTSYLQRRLRIGYARAARLIDILEERGVVGPQDGSKPREILDGGDEEGYGDEDAEEDEEKQ